MSEKLSEADTRAKLIDPELHRRGWTEDFIRRETTPGGIDVVAGLGRRRSAGRVDYTLRIRVNVHSQPIAIAYIEAKKESLAPTSGLEQVKNYSRRFHVPFVFSTNGHLFVEYDDFSGQTSRPKSLADFPSPVVLQERYEKGMGFKLSDPAARPLLAPYKGGEGTRRYYQDAAIRAVLEKLIVCEKKNVPKRALLALATGAGKTFIAVNLLRKIADAGQLRKALFVCDRDELRTQGLTAFQNLFGADAAPVSSGKPQLNARVLIATYQTLDVANEEDTATFLVQNYPENYFSHIIIDECHRSAWGKWSQVLTRNPKAAQVGLTATPRELEVSGDTPEAKSDIEITADNLRYFGDSVYEYGIGQGIEDGYLAACEIQKGRVNLDDTGITIEDVIARSPVDANTGQPISEAEVRELYEKTTYEDRILLPDRVEVMCKDLFQYLIQTGGPEQKTIIFCVRDRHADDVAIQMNNLYADQCKRNGKARLHTYAFRCTAQSGGSNYIADLRGSTRSHFIATTVDLLSTGVDVPIVRNIVFFKYVRSPISFYQMVGRGTRLHPPTNKLMFRVYDYTDASRLFGQSFITKIVQTPAVHSPGGSTGGTPEKTIQVQGFDVKITQAGTYILTMVDGQETAVTVEEYKEMISERLVAEAPSLEEFRARWIKPDQRQELLEHLPANGKGANVIQEIEEMFEYDLYDVLGEIGYGLNPRTREGRAEAFTYKNSEWLEGLPSKAAKTIRALASQFARGGTEGLEKPEIFQTPEVRQAGGLAALTALGEPAALLMQTKERMFAA